MTSLLNRRTKRLAPADRSWIRETVALLTAGEEPRPQVDFARLDERDELELLTLTETICGGGRDVEMSRLSAAETGRFFELVEKGAEFERGHYERRAREATEMLQTRDRTAKARKITLSRREVSHFFQRAYRELADGEIWADDLGVLSLLLALFSTGKTFNSAAYFEGAGDTLTLHFDVGYGFRGAVDGTGKFDDVNGRLDHLHEQEWIILTKHGPAWSLRLGPRLRYALDGTQEVTP